MIADGAIFLAAPLTRGRRACMRSRSALATSSRDFHRGRQPAGCRRAYSSAVAQE
jgi:hypothetical protein